MSYRYRVRTTCQSLLYAVCGFFVTICVAASFSWGGVVTCSDCEKDVDPFCQLECQNSPTQCLQGVDENGENVYFNADSYKWTPEEHFRCTGHGSDPGRDCEWDTPWTCAIFRTYRGTGCPSPQICVSAVLIQGCNGLEPGCDEGT